MPKTVSTSEAKNQFSAMMSWAEANKDEVIIENHGQPRAVIMSYVEFKSLQGLKERARHQAALERLRQLDAEASIRNQDLTEEAVDDLADRFAHEFYDDLAREGKIRIERDRR